LRRIVVALAIAMTLGGPAAVPGAPPASPSPSPSPSPLTLDVEKHVDQVLAEEASKGAPRFETTIEVVGKSPQIMLERFFGGVDLECGPIGSLPPGGGAPTVAETREFRPHPPPTADFGALIAAVGQAVAKKLKGKGPEKYFLYRVHSQNGEKYLLREGRVPASWLDTLPGTRFDLVAAFPDLDSGVKGWKRLERGFPTVEGSNAPPPQPWQTTTCRPRR
jgi:hypothetical protein